MRPSQNASRTVRTPDLIYFPGYGPSWMAIYRPGALKRRFGGTWNDQMAKTPPLKPNAGQLAQMDRTWQRYRRLVIGLRGLWGEVLAVHLTIEGEIEERLRLMIPHPDRLLARASFDQKLTLLLAMWPGPERLGGDAIQEIKRLNAIRNMIAHGTADEAIAKAVHELLCQASDRYRLSPKTHDDAVDGLRSLALGVCGYVVGATEGEAFDALRKQLIESAGLAEGGA